MKWKAEVNLLPDNINHDRGWVSIFFKAILPTFSAVVSPESGNKPKKSKVKEPASHSKKQTSHVEEYTCHPKESVSHYDEGVTF